MNTSTTLCDVDAANRFPGMSESVPSHYWGQDLQNASPDARADMVRKKIGEVLSYWFLTGGAFQCQAYRFCVIGRLDSLRNMLTFEVRNVCGGDVLITVEVGLQDGTLFLNGKYEGVAQTHEDVQALIEMAFRANMSRSV